MVDVLVNAILLRNVYIATRQYWRPVEELNKLVPLGWAAMLAIEACYAGLFLRFGKRGTRKGVEFGLWIGAASLAGGVGLATLVAWPLRLLAALAIQQFANALILGVCFGWFSRAQAA